MKMCYCLANEFLGVYKSLGVSFICVQTLEWNSLVLLQRNNQLTVRTKQFEVSNMYALSSLKFKQTYRTAFVKTSPKQSVDTITLISLYTTPSKQNFRVFTCIFKCWTSGKSPKKIVNRTAKMTIIRKKIIITRNNKLRENFVLYN